LNVELQGYYAHCCLDVVKVAFCLLILVLSVKLAVRWHAFCNDRYDCAFNRLVEDSASLGKYTRENPDQPEKS